jgi:hypothetical protein
MRYILVFLLSILTVLAFSQPVQRNTNVTAIDAKLRIDSSVRLPLDTLLSADSGSLAYRNQRLWVKVGTIGRQWTSVVDSAWTLRGNTTGRSIDTLGKLDAGVIDFINNNSRWLRVYNSGRQWFGAGTPSDSIAFNFYGNHRIQGTSTILANSPRILLQSPNDSLGRIDFSEIASTFGTYLEYNGANNRMNFGRRFGGNDAVAFYIESQSLLPYIIANERIDLINSDTIRLNLIANGDRVASIRFGDGGNNFGGYIINNGSQNRLIFGYRVANTDNNAFFIKESTPTQVNFNNAVIIADSTVNNRRLYVNGTVGINKDSLPIRTTEQWFVQADTTTNQLVRQRIIAGTAVWEGSVVNANSTIDIPFTVSGVAVGDEIAYSVPTAVQVAGLMYNVFVSNSNEVTVRVANVTTSNITITTGVYNFNVRVFKR